MTTHEMVLTGLNLVKQGKVRDIYDLGDSLLMVATDRISAFDVVLPNPIPGKGRILTQMSRFWFDHVKDIVANHLITTDIKAFPSPCKRHADYLKDRSMLVRKAQPLPVECIVRGYLSGSGWKSYQESGKVCGISLPKGLRESDRLPEPLFTPSTKEEAGAHDVNISFDEAGKLLGKKLAEKVRQISVAVYRRGTDIAEKKGIIIADTKFEFGMIGSELVLIDEIMTPDSSRFWPKDTYKTGGSQMSFDKQYVRDYLLAVKWNQKPPAPELPSEVVENTRKKYQEALERLTT